MTNIDESIIRIDYLWSLGVKYHSTIVKNILWLVYEHMNFLTWKVPSKAPPPNEPRGIVGVIGVMISGRMRGIPEGGGARLRCSWSSSCRVPWILPIIISSSLNFGLLFQLRLDFWSLRGKILPGTSGSWRCLSTSPSPLAKRWISECSWSG